MKTLLPLAGCVVLASAFAAADGLLYSGPAPSAAADSDGDGIEDLVDDCPTEAEDFDGVADADGCPDSDVSVDYQTEEEYFVWAGDPITQAVHVETLNGNLTTDVRATATLLTPIGDQCEASFAMEPALIIQVIPEYDADGDTVADSFYSTAQWDHLAMSPGEERLMEIDYTVECATSGPHQFDLEVTVQALPPVVEEDGADNARASTIVVTGLDLADAKLLAFDVLGRVENDCDDPIEPMPESIAVGDVINLCVSRLAHNNGPTPAQVEEMLTASASGCQATPPSASTSISFPVSVQVARASVVSVVCGEPGPRSALISAGLEVTQAYAFDPDPDNHDGAESIAFDVIADSDGDGHWDANETAKGSDPVDAGSTPERCNGADDDGDTVTDEPPANSGRATPDPLCEAAADPDGDTVANALDTDDDGDGFSDASEWSMSTDALAGCPVVNGHDAWPPDAVPDGDANIGDLITLFGNGKILQEVGDPFYSARSDSDGNGEVNIGDLVGLFGGGRILTSC